MNGAREANRHFLPKLPRHHLADPNKSQPIRWSDLMRPGRLIGLLLGPEPDPVEVAQLREKLAKEELPEFTLRFRDTALSFLGRRLQRETSS